MDIWDIASYAAWAASGLILLWMVADAIKVNRDFDESLLMSSQEGIDELLDHPATAGRPGREG
jgi:hypothetical protein